jgi:spermidine synthase
MSVEAHSSNRRIITLVVIFFFLSGLSGMIYEILWTRMIVKIIGGAPFAVSIVVAVFMGGLGLGSYLASRFIDRIKDPVKLVLTYGVLEIVIAAYCMALPILLKTSLSLFAILYNQLFSHFMIYSFLIFLGCGLLLILPATCMGATLPILCRFYVKKLDQIGNRAGRLFGINTIGAAAGSLLCGFWLIDWLGIWGSQILAVLINATVGLSCIWIGLCTKPHLIETEPEQAESDQIIVSVPSTSSRHTGICALVVFGMSGFCAMAYEVIWTRLLGLVAGPTTYSFTLVLVSFITCLALGGIFFGWLGDRVHRPMHLLLTTQCLAALFVLLASQLIGNSQVFFAKLIFSSQGRFAQMHLAKAVSIFGFLFCPAFLLGAALPLVSKIYTRSVGKIGHSIGFAYAINTIGAVLGSFCAGFVLIPMLGKERAIGWVVALQIATCMLVTWVYLKQAKKSIWKLVPLFLVGLVGLVLCFHYPLWNRDLMSRGIYHRFSNVVSGDFSKVGWSEALFRGTELFTTSTRNKLIYYGDGIGGLTTVSESTNVMGKTELFMYIEGKSDASSMQDMHTQTLLAHLPLLFHANPKTVMVLGLASGITAAEILHYPIERLDVLEINPQVVEGSAFFRPWNNMVLSNPKTDLIIQDGRAHLQLTDRTYDIIISEPSNPWMAGLANLFTQDFFELANDRLNPNGIFVQFFHSYEMDWRAFSLVGRTFAEIFPNSLCVTTNPGLLGPDYLFVGLKGDQKLSLENAQKNIVFARQSSNMRLSDPRLIYRLVLSEDLKFFFGDGPANTDNRPRLEFAAPRLMYRTDLDVESQIAQKGMQLTHQTIGIRKKMIQNIDYQIEFAAYVFSLHLPLPYKELVDLSDATPQQAERFYEIIEAFAKDHEIDYSIFEKKEEIRHRLLLVQIEALKQRIEIMPNNRALMQKHLLELQTLADATN